MHEILWANKVSKLIFIATKQRHVHSRGRRCLHRDKVYSCKSFQKKNVKHLKTFRGWIPSKKKTVVTENVEVEYILQDAF